MPARIYVEVTAAELKELSKELDRLAGVSLECAKLLEKTTEKSYSTDGLNSAIEGLDSIAKSLGRIVGPFNSAPAKLGSLRTKVENWRSAKRAAQVVRDHDASKTEQPSGGIAEGISAKSRLKPIRPTPPTSRRKKE